MPHVPNARLPNARLPKVLVVCVLLAAGLVGCSLIGDEGAAKAPDTEPCAGPRGVGGAVPAGLGPGDLVAANQLVQSAYTTSPGFPGNGRVWRILYVSTGADSSDLQLVCGLVVAPVSGPRTDYAAGDGRTGRMFAWAHGTIGLQQRCQPSSSVAFWGPMPDGIGAIAWGTPILLNRHEGSARDGLLQYAVDHGWVVAATDYQPPDTYLSGRIAAANVLDANRAAAQLVANEWPASAPQRYRTVVAGHSQGGHTAVFTGQLAESYLAATRPSRPTASFQVVGVDAEAPATNFVADPSRQPGVQFGDGLADAEMHQTVKPLILDLPAITVQIGPALFSYIFGSWQQLSKRATASAATLPAFPATGPLDLRAIATPKGTQTVADLVPVCLDQLKAVQEATGPYRDAKANAMLVAPIWNLPPTGYTVGEQFKGGFDRTCATTTDPATTAWCDWVRWNVPGPLGVNPYPKVPTWGGTPIPSLIAQGEADDIVNCLAAGDLPAAEPVGAARCSSRTLYDALATAAYCPSGAPSAGYLQMDLYRRIRFRSPADHFSISGQTAAKGQSRATDDLTFEGSRMQRFVTGAFAGRLTPGCSVVVANGRS